MHTLLRDNLGLATGLAVAAFILLTGSVAHANQSFFASGVTTHGAASTSPAYMTPGTGTSTTPVYDAYAQTCGGGRTSKADQAGLLVQFNGSSTSAVLSLAVEYSQDGVDWYRNFVIDPAQAGTTTPLSVVSPFAISWKYAAAVLGGAGVSGTSTAAFAVPTPFRYTRVVASITGANGAAWMQLVPVKEQC